MRVREFPLAPADDATGLELTRALAQLDLLEVYQSHGWVPSDSEPDNEDNDLARGEEVEEVVAAFVAGPRTEPDQPATGAGGSSGSTGGNASGSGGGVASGGAIVAAEAGVASGGAIAAAETGADLPPPQPPKDPWAQCAIPGWGRLVLDATTGTNKSIGAHCTLHGCRIFALNVTLHMYTLSGKIQLSRHPPPHRDVDIFAARLELA